MSVNNINSTGPKHQVDNQKLNQQQQATNQAASQAQTQKAQSAPVRSDSVSLTQSAQQLAQVQKKSSDAPVNQEKVERLKKAIQNGEYRVDPQKLAANIARVEAELFGTDIKK